MDGERCAGGLALKVRSFDGYRRGDCPTCGKDLLTVAPHGHVWAHQPSENPVAKVAPEQAELLRQIEKHHDLYRYASVPPRVCPECQAPLAVGVASGR